MATSSMFGKKMQKKSWDSSEIDKDWEDKKIMIIFFVIILIFIFLFFFMFYLRSNLVR